MAREAASEGAGMAEISVTMCDQCRKAEAMIEVRFLDTDESSHSCFAAECVTKLCRETVDLADESRTAAE